VAGEIWRRVAEGATLFARLKIERDHDNLEYDIFGVPDLQVSAFDLYDQQSTKQGGSNVVLMVGRETEFELAARPDAAVEA
jgi:hypothetical protein